MKKTHITVLFLFSLVLTSCGFHLRGSQDFSAVLPELQIEGTDKHSELGRELIQSLASAKVKVLDESDTLLRINREAFNKRVLSVDSSGLANQYELTYQLSFALLKKLSGENVTSDKKQKEAQPHYIDLIAAQSIHEKRDYLFDSALILAKSEEESRLKNDMRRAAVLQLMRRLQFSLLSNSKKQGNK